MAIQFEYPKAKPKPAKSVTTRVSTPVSTPPPAVSTSPKAGSDAERVRRWRAANRERYNTSMREYRKRVKEAPDGRL